MGDKIKDAVRLRAGSGIEEGLAEAADCTGVAGDAWTDHRGEWVNLVHEDAQVYACRGAAADLVPAWALADAPF